MALNLKRFLIIMGIIFAVILIDILLTQFGARIPALGFIFAVLLVALASSPAYDVYTLRKKQQALYPELKQRVLQTAKNKKGIVAKGELGKMPSEWYGWFVKQLEADGLAMRDPRSEDLILFPKILAESRTEDEIMAMDLPMSVGAEILKLKEESGRKVEE
jgi:hypothetical protein